MNNKFDIWKARYSTGWYVITPDGDIYLEDSFTDAIMRMNICILNSESV